MNYFFFICIQCCCYLAGAGKGSMQHCNLSRISTSKQISCRVTRLGDLSPFGRLFKALGDNLFGPNRPNFWRLFGRFFKVDQNLKFLCYKIIIIAVNFQNKIFFKVFWKKIGQLLLQKGPKICIFTHKNKQKLTRRFWATFFFELGYILLKPSGHPARLRRFIGAED